jgi:LDH2 family malate/lactate/ureidoglycolate dehydrogenase
MNVIRQRGNVALLDGDAGPGQVVGHRAMTLAIEMAQTGGVGVVGVYQSSHFGTGAFFVEQAARAGMLGLTLTNAPANMPPAGGRSRFFGTNPLAIGLPSATDRPIVLDMSTSVVARGKIVMAHKAGEPIPPGWAIDEEGRPTQDTGAALRGAVLPMAGYKGAGLALMIDLLCGLLTGAAFGPHIVDLYDESDRHQNVGHFFMAVDIDVFIPIEAWKARVEEFAQEVRSQPRQPGVDRIYLPGEIEYERIMESARTGVLLPEAGWSELDELAMRLDVQPIHERIDHVTRLT